MHKGTFFALVAEHRSIASVLVVVVATLAVGFYLYPTSMEDVRGPATNTPALRELLANRPLLNTPVSNERMRASR